VSYRLCIKCRKSTECWITIWTVWFLYINFCFPSLNSSFKHSIWMAFWWKNCSYASCCIWVWNLASYFDGWTQTEGIRDSRTFLFFYFISSFFKILIYHSSAEFWGWFLMKGKSHKTFDIVVSTKMLIF